MNENVEENINKIIVEDVPTIKEMTENSDRRNFSIAYVKKNELSDNELKNKIMILREILFMSVT